MDDERAQRYAAAVENAVLPVRVRQVMAVAHAEQADLLERLDDQGLTALYASEACAMWKERAEDAKAKVAAAAERLGRLIENVEADDSGAEDVCHDYDRVDDGECALLADLRRVRAALDGDQP